MTETPNLDFANAIIARNRRIKIANIIGGTIAVVAVAGSVLFMVERLTRTSDGGHDLNI